MTSEKKPKKNKNEKERFWLVKTEPDEYSWETLATEGGTSWDGIRNYQARNNLRDMKPGDKVLVYHSGKAREIVGLAEVASPPYPDPGADDDTWTAVDLRPLHPLGNPVGLDRIKSDERLADMALVRQSRLSVMPVKREEFDIIAEMSETGPNKN